MVKELTLNKVAAALVGVAMVVGLASALAVSRAHAITLGELVELFIALEVIPADKADEARAVLSSQGSGTTGGDMSCYFDRNLSQGDMGSDVKDLQELLNANGFTVSAAGAGSPGMETEYFGPATAGAVAAMQEAFASEILAPLGLTAGTGYFGASTRAKANEICTPSVPTVPTTPGDDDDEDMDDEDDKSGRGEGSIDSTSQSSADNSNLDEGEEGGVLAFEVEIEGDIMIDRVDIYAVEDGTTAGASNNADDYFESASLWVDGDKVAEIDVSDWDEDRYSVATTTADEFRIRFTNLDLWFEDGDEPEFQVAFEVRNNLDSADLAASWDVEADSFRHEDGEGWTDTENLGYTENFGFDAEDIAELRVSAASSNPDASTIEVDDNSLTRDVPVFVFDIEERNGVDATVQDLTVTITTSPTANEDVVVATASLWDGSTELDSVNVPATGIVLFENLDLDIDADDEVRLTVKLTFEDTDDQAAYQDGETVTVAFTSITDVTDENGNDEGEITISGTPSSETHTLYEAGLVVEVVSANTAVTDNEGAASSAPDSVTFTWKLDLTAFGGEDVYVNADFADIVTAAAGQLEITYTVEKSTGADLTSLSGTITSSADEVAGDAGAYGGAYSGESFYLIESGTTESVTIVVTGTNQTDAKQVQAYLSGVEWTTDFVDVDVTYDASSPSVQTFTSELADDSETGFEYIN